MLWNKYFLPSFLLMIIVAALHWLASEMAYYWTLNWYDYVMHFLGGAWVALFGLWIGEMPFAARIRPFMTARNIVLYVLAVGIAWEFLELALHFTSASTPGYAWDTTHDLIMDVLGSASVVFITRRINRTIRP